MVTHWIIATLIPPLIMVSLKTRWMMVKGCGTCYSIAQERRKRRSTVGYQKAGTLLEEHFGIHVRLLVPTLIG